MKNEIEIRMGKDIYILTNPILEIIYIYNPETSARPATFSGTADKITLKPRESK